MKGPRASMLLVVRVNSDLHSVLLVVVFQPLTLNPGCSLNNYGTCGAAVADCEPPWQQTNLAVNDLAHCGSQSSHSTL